MRSKKKDRNVSFLLMMLRMMIIFLSISICAGTISMFISIYQGTGFVMSFIFTGTSTIAISALIERYKEVAKDASE